MAKTTDYQRGYGKGYNTGKTSADRRLAEMHDQQKRLAERAERTEKQQGLGHCEDCAHYTKGGDSCAWGYCEAAKTRHAGTPWGTWIRAEDDQHRDARVMVAMRFGCVLFTRRTTPDRTTDV